MKRTWLGIDQGSTATKAILIDRRGQVCRAVTLAVETRKSPRGFIEHDPERLLRSVQRALHRVTEGIPGDSIAAAGISCQRSTCLFWSRRTGKPLTPALSWQDRRGESLCRQLAPHASLVSRVTGLRLTSHYAASKIRWLLDRNPGLRALVARGEAIFGTLDSFLLFRLTNGSSWSTDPTHAARTLLMDLRRCRWSRELLDLFRIPGAGLPPIRPSASRVGAMTVRGARVPVAATVGDQQAALLGVGCLKRGAMVVNCGTGAFVAVNTGTRPVREPGLLTSVAFSTAESVRYLLEGTVNAAGSAVDWMRATLAPAGRGTMGRDTLDRLPVIIPAFAGLGAPHWRSDVGAAILDLQLGTRTEDLHTAMLAGIACRIQEVIEKIRRSGAGRGRILVSGGLSNRSDFLAILSLLTDSPLFLSRVRDATARGAALLAGHAMGEWSLARSNAPSSPARRIPKKPRGWGAEAFRRRFEIRLRQLMAPPSPPHLEI